MGTVVIPKRAKEELSSGISNLEEVARTDCDAGKKEPDESKIRGVATLTDRVL